jgi:DnaK suppressor protein
MHEDQLKVFRRALIELKSDLEHVGESELQAVRTVELDQSTVGRLSRMDAMQSQEMARELRRRREDRIRRVAGALGRIESGDYGVCFVCGEDIDPRRLAVDPTHTRCIDCAES